MTDDQWRAETDPLAMLRAVYPLRSEGSDAPQPRACRAYLFACARAQWERLPEPARALVALGELANEQPRRGPLWRELERFAEALRHADEPPTRAWLAERSDEQARAALGRLAGRGRFRFDSARPEPELDETEWRALALLLYLPFARWVPPFAWVPRHLHSADLIRETHGSALVPPAFEPQWRTETAQALARPMHETRQFGAMPILADALQDAGCEDEQILNHCRDRGAAHARGCWVLDRVLGFA